MTVATTAPNAVPRRVLADLVPAVRYRDAALVAGFAVLTALCAQIVVPLPWTPVPLTGQTFAVLLSGAALGARRGALAQALYVGLGVVGLPVYADRASGWTTATGATGGYLLGFVVAALLVGALAERRLDRSPLTALPALLAGTAVIYAFGVAWLAQVLDVSFAKAVDLGLVPFLAGDAIKLGLASALLPATWRLVSRRDA